MNAPEGVGDAAQEGGQRLVVALDGGGAGGRIQEIGGKALGLQRLVEAGLPVPGAFIVTSRALDLFLRRSGLSEPAVTADEEELRDFQDRLRTTPLPDDLLARLGRAYHEWIGADRPVAVRSSGAMEDLADASFAGLYKTRLNVLGMEGLADALRECWASAWAPRVQEYLHHRAERGPVAMSVVVQEMVDARVSGVMFTVNPLTGREEEILVESAYGLGEGLVSGRVDADRFVVEAHTGRAVERTLARKDRRVVSGDEGIAEVPVPPEMAETASLSKAEIRRLADVGRQVQEYFGRPMDVEWAFHGDRLWLLQARPITRLSFAPELGEWTTADFRDGGVSSDVCTPFMWSLYDAALSISMPAYFQKLRLLPKGHEATWGRMFFGRPYWNLGEVKRALEKLAGYDEAEFHADMGVEVDPDFEPRRTPTTLGGILGALPTLMALQRSYREQLEKVEVFSDAFEGRASPFDRTPEQLEQLDPTVFARRYRELITELYLDTETTYFTTIYNTSNAKLDLGKVVERVGRVLKAEVDTPTLLGGLRDVSHLRPVKDLHRIAGRIVAGDAELDDETVRDFAWSWRHRGRKELDIRAPRWCEDPEHVRAMMEVAVAAYEPGQDPEALEDERHRAYRRALAGLVRRLGWRPLLRGTLHRRLRRMRRYAWWREEMRDRSSFVYYLVRVWTLEAARREVEAGRLETEDDIWFLPWARVVELLDGRLSPADARAEIARGRHVHRSFRNFDNPDEIGAHFRPGGAEPEGEVLRGTPCSPGEASGPARVIRTLEEAKRVEKGDILVTTFTDPGWTVLFSRLGGVITETGGVLSHAAVISREYGIPAVLGVADATERIGDGDRIRIDGRRGWVEIEESASSSAPASLEESGSPDSPEPPTDA